VVYIKLRSYYENSGSRGKALSLLRWRNSFIS